MLLLLLLKSLMLLKQTMDSKRIAQTPEVEIRLQPIKKSFFLDSLSKKIRVFVISGDKIESRSQDISHRFCTLEIDVVR